jgi:uncharacterized protein
MQAQLSSRTDASEATAPWYKHLWPWLLMSGPAAVLVAAVPTAYLAFSSADGLVADDYYKQGLGINQQIRRDKAAAAADIAVTLGMADRMLTASVTSRGAPVPNQPVTLTLVHGSQQKHDVLATLAPGGDGVWRAALPTLKAGRYHAVAETREWRVVSGAFHADGQLTGITLRSNYDASKP